MSKSREDIYDREIERQLLAGIIQYPDKYFEIDAALSEDDFYSEGSILHKVIFNTIKTSLEKDDGLDPVILASKIRGLQIQFQDPIEIEEYLKSLKARKIPESEVIKVFKELKRISIRRAILDTCRKVAMYVKKPEISHSAMDIVSKSDEIYNQTLSSFDSDIDKPTSIFSGILDLIEDIADNPEKHNSKIPCPHEIVAKVYGSLLRNGHITVVVSRTGVGKTTFTMDYCFKSHKLSGIPVLHLDNGEMSADELKIRQASARTGLSTHLFESGEWRKLPKEKVQEIREILKQHQGVCYDYYNIAGMTVDQMCSLVKKYYYKNVGRGNRMILLFDYIKPPKSSRDASEWAAVGEIVDGFKQLIHKKILFNGNPVISMITSVQANRAGTVGNKSSEEVIDDESIVSMSDRIAHYCSHLLILRKKTLDELIRDTDINGEHKLIGIKARALGEWKQRFLSPTKMPDGTLEKYFISFDFSDFDVKEKMDLVQISEMLTPNRAVFKKNKDEDKGLS